MVDTDQREQVARWIEEEEVSLQKVDEELVEVMKRHSQLRKRLDALLRLQESFDASEEVGEVSPAAVDTVFPSGFELFTGKRGGTRERIVSQTREILSDEGRPMHISDIVEGFRRRNFTIPGKGEAVNISAHLTRSENVVSTGWGMYGLPEWQKGSSSK